MSKHGCFRNRSAAVRNRSSISSKSSPRDPPRPVMPTKEQKERTSRPFPWPCSNCLAVAVVPTVMEYTAKVKHDGVVYEFHFPAFEVPRCQTCCETYTTTAV